MLSYKTKKVVLITGASTGLGLAIAKRFITDKQFFLILTARPSSLSRFSKQNIIESEFVKIRPLDVLEKSHRDQIFAEAEKNWGGVDILINNAGYSLRAVAEHVGEMERYRQMDTNFRAPLALIRRALPSMRKKRSGHIINISSVGGMMAMPTMAIYSASKFALEGASESLWYEVRPWNIKVTLVQPGFIHSRSFQNVKLSHECSEAIEDKNNPYHYHYNSMSKFIENLMALTPITPDLVAKKVLKIAKKKNPPLRVAGTWDAHFFSLLRTFLPRFIYHRVLYWSLPQIRRWGK